MTPLTTLVSSQKKARLLALGIFAALLLVACNSEVTGEPGNLLLSPDDFSGVSVSVASASEQESLDGPSAQVELEGPDFRVLQSLLIFETEEAALAALDAIRADLVSRGETGPGERQTSGVFNDRIGVEDAASLFFIERNALVRLTVSGPERGNPAART